MCLCCVSCVLFGSAQPTHLNIVACGPWHDISVVPGPSRLVLLCTAHALEHRLWRLCAHGMNISVVPGPSRLVLLCTAHALEHCRLWPMA
jgi:hypothetical protein